MPSVGRRDGPPKIPPPWVVHTAWRVHRALHRLSGGRFLWTTSNKRGWGEGHPSWWLNLEARPDAVVRLAGQRPRTVRAREAVGQERDRLWQRWAAVDPDLDGYAARRSTETPVVVLEPGARPS